MSNNGNQAPQSSEFMFKLMCLVVAFLIGGALAIKGYPPFNFLQQGYSDTKTLITELLRERHPLLEKRKYTGEGVTTYDRAQAFEGTTLLQGIFSDGLEIRLIDMDGNLIQRWPLDFFEIWPNPTHLSPNKVPRSPYDYHSQGVFAAPDGSIIVNFGYLGTVKLDKCGEVMWTVDRMTRHHVTPTADGNYWIGANREIDEIAEHLLFFGIKRSWLKETYQRYENTLLLIDADGNILKEVSVLEPFFTAGLEGHIFDSLKITRDDPTHHNNVEEVTEALAAKIEGVEAGDLLLSIRNMHMLVILDQDTYEIKWSHSGPWTRQHDPDIMPNGNIRVFNNSRANYGFNRVLGSSLVELDPATASTQVVHPKSGQKGFYSRIFGTHQALPNGNIFVSEGLTGRVFEINSNGEIVWEHISQYDEEYASIVEEAYRYEPDYFSVSDWDCNN